MPKSLTFRRVLGALLMLAGLSLIAIGILSGQSRFNVIGMVCLWLFGIGLLFALLQRANMLMHMVDSAKTDLHGLASWQQQHPETVRNQLGRLEREQRRAIAGARDETLRLRKEVKRALADVLGSVSRGQAEATRAYSVQQLSIVRALLDATSRHQQSAGDLQQSVDDLQQAIDALQQPVGGLAEAHQHTLRALSDHSTLALRAYRDLRAEMEAREERINNFASELDAGLSKLASAAQNRTEEVVAMLQSVITDEDQGLKSLMGAISSTQESIGGLVASYEEDKRLLKAISKDEKVLRSISRRGLQWLKYETVKEVEAVLQLRQVLDVDRPTPLMGGWAMDAESVLALVQLVLERKPALVVELGSGASTVWVAMALRHLGAGKIVSFDHLSDFTQATRRALETAGLKAWGEVREAPLADIYLQEKTFRWYSIEDAASDGPVDMLLVDGPPGSTGPLARYPAVPFYLDVLSDNALVVVDDISRQDEQKILERWTQEIPGIETCGTLGPRTALLRRNVGSVRGRRQP